MEGTNNVQAISTVILVVVTAYYAISTSKILKESRKDRKRDEVLEILSLGMYPIWNELLSHEKKWERSKYNESHSQYPYIKWPDIHHYLSFSDISKETTQKKISNSISTYKNTQEEYKSKRREVKGKINDIIESDPYRDWVSSGIDTEVNIRKDLKKNSHTYANNILFNRSKLDKGIEENFQLIDDELFEILEYECINKDIDELDRLSSRLQDENTQLQNSMKLASLQLKNDYSILDTSIHSYREKNLDLGSTDSPLTTLWRELDDYYPP